MAEPYTGFRAMKAGLLTNTYMEAMHIQHNKQSYADLQLSKDKDAMLAVSYPATPAAPPTSSMCCSCSKGSAAHGLNSRWLSSDVPHL